LLTHDAPDATHRIAAPQGLVFAEADIKSPVVAVLPLGSRIAVTATEGAFHALATGGFVHDRHAGALTPASGGDPVAVAMSFIGTPYRWGGRTRAGIDCSGLVQQALMACGVACPRDSDQQRDGLGTRIDAADLRRGDLVYFPGHVGIMADAANLLHANAHWMATVIEPLADVVARVGGETPILAVKRV
jgi:cell wall-associated NlpC family hydrolase